MSELFAVMLAKQDQEITQAIKEKFPDGHYPLSATTFIVASDDDANTLLDQFGIGREESEGETGGVIFSLNGQYSGFFKGSFWEWIRIHRG